MLVSVEVAGEIEAARKRGYAAAIVLEECPNGSKAFHMSGSKARIVPCPAETRGTTCVECRLCIGGDLLERNMAIAFKVHGSQAAAAHKALK